MGWHRAGHLRFVQQRLGTSAWRRSGSSFGEGQDPGPLSSEEATQLIRPLFILTTRSVLRLVTRCPR